MNIEEIKELMDALAERDIEELEIEHGGERIRIRRRVSSEGTNQSPYIVVASGAPVAEGTTLPAVTAAPSSAPAALSDAPEPAAEPDEREPRAHDHHRADRRNLL